MKISLQTKIFLLSRWNVEFPSVRGVIDCCHCPRYANTQKDVDSITAGHISDTRIRIFVLNGSHFTSERICERFKGWRGKQIKWNAWLLSPGILVPRATNTMAVTESLMPNVQPKCDATSPMIAVTTPMHRMEITKHKYPPAMSVVE